MDFSRFYSDWRIPWLGHGGESSDIVLASWARIARNFDRLPFPGRADDDELLEAESVASHALTRAGEELGVTFQRFAIDDMTPTERSILVEKHFVSQGFITDAKHRDAFISDDQSLDIMVNEDDHLIIQAMTAGFDTMQPLVRVLAADDALEAQIDFAFDKKLGYLTASPTNLGTGLHLMSLLHLPGLVYTRNMENISGIVQQLGLSISGVYMEGNSSAGNIFAVANQTTLGISEQGMAEKLSGAIRDIISHERSARSSLVQFSPDRIEDAVWRALGILKYSRSLGEREAFDLMSNVRLGIDMGFIDMERKDAFSDILVAIRPNFLRRMMGDRDVSLQEAAKKRAFVVREILSGKVPDDIT